MSFGVNAPRRLQPEEDANREDPPFEQLPLKRFSRDRGAKELAGDALRKARTQVDSVALNAPPLELSYQETLACANHQHGPARGLSFLFLTRVLSMRSSHISEEPNLLYR